MFTQKTIAVFGTGMVGSQVVRWYEQFPEFRVLSWSPSRSPEPSAQILNEAEWFFLCVPTPYVEGKEYDLTALEENIKRIPDGKLIIIKSTVNPGTTDFMQERYPNKIFMFNPEFLTELTAWEDFKDPDMQILGVPHQAYKFANEVIQTLPRSPIMSIVSPIDAEWIKKARNAFYATKVIFFNQLYDLMNETTADYETIRQHMVQDPRIANSHSFIFHKNYRGFGGKCLPKDLYSLIGYGDRMSKETPLFDVVRELNKKYLHEQGIPDWA